MKNKLIFRILGALASALIIVSVFIPFINVTGYSPSLWESYKLINALYLPIMIIVFGAIGVIFFALNIKTEFAYMSVGAISFFAVMQTIDILDQGVFSTLGVGYYCLVIGALVTGVMAFLTNLKTKNKVEVVQEVKKETETSMLDQIDKLYNEQTTNQSEISPIQPIDNVVQPLPVQPLETVTPIKPVEQIIEEKTIEELPVNPVIQETVVQPVKESIVEQTPIVQEQSVNSVLQEFNVPMPEEVQVQEVPVVEQQPVVETSGNQSLNPVLQEFAQPVNPVLQEFNVPMPEEVQVQEVTVVEQQPVVETSGNQSLNPVLQEFAQPINPVVQEFGISPESPVEQAPAVQEQPTINQEVATVPLASINEPMNPAVQQFTNPGSTVAPQQNSNELDIFGQPINK